MKYNLLGRTDLSVSLICLGTMAFGSDLTQEESFEQLDYAQEQGINFLDSAEIYPVPVNPEYQGRSEEIIGNWLQARKNRDQVIIASKVAAPGDAVNFIRPRMALDEKNIRQAIQQSLKRLKTDYIDLYQLHWPDRVTNYFGRLNYQHQPEQDGASIEETLEVLNSLVKEGLVRHIGLSNESAWGSMKYIQLAEAKNLPRCISVQNPFSLLNRTVEIGLTEVLQRENLSLLPYSPLGFGVLSGKYLNNARPEGARITKYPQFSRYCNEQGDKATQAYVELAREHDIEPTAMALAWVNSRPYVSSNIIGASNMTQLKANIASADIQLNQSLLEGIEAIHTRYPNPCP